MHELEAVLLEVRGLLARPDNDFAWSSWNDQQAALAEIDSLIADVRCGRLSKMTLDVLFLPTGPIQEVSVSRGWGQEFVEIASRYDAAVAVAATAQQRRWWRFW